MSARAAIGSLWEQAACQTADPELFFPVSGAGAGLAVARAKAVCASCAVRQQCLDFAVETRQPHGVWGGTTEQERRAIAARRQQALVRQARALSGASGWASGPVHPAERHFLQQQPDRGGGRDGHQGASQARQYRADQDGDDGHGSRHLDCGP